MAIISKTYGRLLAILMAWLGYSCDIFTTADEYGTPTATFKAIGTVISQADDVPIEGIRAVMKTEKGAVWYGIDTVYTDSKGVFNLKSRIFDFNKLYVELTDVDGEKNGSFIDKEIEADYSNEKFTGGDKHWYRGEAEKDLGILKLTPKEWT